MFYKGCKTIFEISVDLFFIGNTDENSNNRVGNQSFMVLYPVCKVEGITQALFGFKKRELCDDMGLQSLCNYQTSSAFLSQIK